MQSIYGILLILWCSCIFMLSSQSVLPTPMLFAFEDKLVHACAYGLMGLLVWQTLNDERRRALALFGFSIAFCSIYGASDEWHQSFVPGRDASAGDWLADTLGATIVAAFLLYRCMHPAEKTASYD